MTYIVVDVEADGPVPPNFSMVCFGAVVVEPSLSRTFYGQTLPISGWYQPDALAVSGFSRTEHMKFEDPELVMKKFWIWVKNEIHMSNNPDGKATFISDNPAFDWQWINYYFHTFMPEKGNPFGFSARRIGDLYCGMKMDAGKNSEWKKKLRKTNHTHNPVDDAKGNAEALLAMQKMGLKISF